MTRELLLFWGFLFGAAWGSFLAASIWRTRHGVSLGGVSKCTACGEPIHPLENMPVVSWTMLGGRAGCCGARFSPLYNVLELAMGIAFCFLLAVFWQGALALFLLGTLLVIIINYLRRRRMGTPPMRSGTKAS
jgi:leader peptidase (prepilin peptidase)/N-methyltransferase